jgi:hypothetical protein
MNGGRDLSLIDEKLLEAVELTCTLCLNIFRDPVDCPCGHTFCKECIGEVLLRSHQCPIDYKPLSYKQLKPVGLALTNALRKLTTFCDYKTNGCTWKGSWSDLEQHKQGCIYKRFTITGSVPKLDQEVSTPQIVPSSSTSKKRIIGEDKKENKQKKSQNLG